MPEARRWQAFAAEAPELAEAGRALLYHYGPGLGYLATVRRDGGPRLHPVCPVVTHGGLWVFVGNHSPKLHDLHRDGRFALHAPGKEDVDDEFMVAGTAHPVDDAEVFEAVKAVYLAQGTTLTEDETLFELRLDRALHAEYGPRPSWPPVYSRWAAT